MDDQIPIEDTDPVEATPEEHKVELYRLLQETRHNESFDALIKSVPPEEDAVIQAMRAAHSLNLKRLLDPEKLDKLRARDKALWDKVTAHYKAYLEKILRASELSYLFDKKI